MYTYFRMFVFSVTAYEQSGMLEAEDDVSTCVESVLLLYWNIYKILYKYWLLMRGMVENYGPWGE